MPLIQLVEVLIVAGLLLWLVNRFIPMQGSVKSILNGVVIAVVLWILNVFGSFTLYRAFASVKGIFTKTYLELRVQPQLATSHTVITKETP